MNDLLKNLEAGLAAVIWKGVKTAGIAAAGLATSLALKYAHVPLTAEHQASIAIAVSGALGAVLNKLKQSYPDKLSWL